MLSKTKSACQKYCTKVFIIWYVRYTHHPTIEVWLYYKLKLKWSLLDDFLVQKKNTDMLDKSRTEQILCKRWTKVSIMHCNAGNFATTWCSICMSYLCYSQVYRTSFIFFSWCVRVLSSSSRKEFRSLCTGISLRVWREEWGKVEELQHIVRTKNCNPQSLSKAFSWKERESHVSNASWDGSPVADLFALLLSWTA